MASNGPSCDKSLEGEVTGGSGSCAKAVNYPAEGVAELPEVTSQWLDLEE